VVADVFGFGRFGYVGFRRLGSGDAYVPFGSAWEAFFAFFVVASAGGIHAS